MIRKSNYIILFSTILLSCFSSKVSQQTKVKSLDFKNCLLVEKPYNSILIEIPKNYRLKKEINNGFCEYRFKYNEDIFFYVSGDIYSGSSLNYENLYEKGITSYTKNRKDNFQDTIRNYGRDKRSLYWSEYILGDVVVGYLNVPKERKAEFDKAITSIARE